MLSSGDVAGQLICLAAALLWALAVLMFRSPIQRHGAPAVNLAKSTIATLLLAATTAVAGSWHQIAAAPGRDLWLLAFSGLAGITLGDTALFAAVSRLGAHRALLLQTLAPVFTALIAFAATGERLSAGALTGGGIVLIGVGLVVAPREADRRRPVSSQMAGAGIWLGVLSALGQGSGVVLAKAGMATVSAQPATLVRLAVGTIGMVLVLRGTGLAAMSSLARDRRGLRLVVPAAVIGTYLAMFLMMLGISLTPASIAAVLLATTPVFGLVLEALVDRRMPTAAGVVGTLLAVAGVGVLSFSG